MATHSSNLQFALVFPSSPGVVHANRFWSAMAHGAAGMNESDGCRFKVWYRIDGRTETDAFRELLREVRDLRLDGLVFPALPWLLANTPLMDEPGIPRVTIAAPDERFTRLSYVELDNVSFCRKAVDHLINRGRRRFALLIPPGHHIELRWQQAFKERNIDVPAHRIQFVPVIAPEGARNSANLLTRPGQTDRPDALIIGDDNMTEHACLGLADSGVKALVDLDVVAHCNFPISEPSPVPVRRLGFDARRVLAACIESLRRERLFGSKLPTQLIPASFEDELEHSGAMRSPDCILDR